MAERPRARQEFADARRRARRPEEFNGVNKQTREATEELAEPQRRERESQMRERHERDVADVLRESQQRERLAREKGIRQGAVMNQGQLTHSLLRSIYDTDVL